MGYVRVLRNGGCKCPKCAGASDVALVCKVATVPEWMKLLYEQYYLYHVRGGVPLTELPPSFVDCVWADVVVESEDAKKERERRDVKELLKKHGIRK